MNSYTDSTTSYKLLSTAASIIVIVVAGLVLLGWLFNLPALQYILPGLPRMTFNTAVTFVLAGLSLWIYSRISGADAKNGRWRGISLTLAALVTIIGLLTLSEYLFGWDIGLDQLLFEDRAGTEQTTIPGRPSPHSAITFILTGLALLLSQGQNRRRHWLAQYLTISAAFVALLALVGYAFSIPFFFRISPYTGMALHTAINFIILCLGLLFLHPNSGFLATMTAINLGGTMARRLLLAAITVPLVVGWLSIWGERAGLYSSDFAPVLLAVLSAYVLSATIWWYAHSLNQAEGNRKQAESDLRENEARTRLIIESALDAVVTINTRSEITGWNSQAEIIFGRSSQETLGQSLSLILPPQYREAHHRGMQHFLATGEGPYLNRRFEITALRHDGTEFPVELTILPIRAGNSFTFSAFIRDISERKEAEEQFRLVVEASPNAIILVNTVGQISLVNKQAETLFGYNRKDLLGQPVETLVPHRFRTHHDYYRATFLSDPTARPMGAGRDLYGLRKDGSEVPIEIGLNPITTAEGNFVLASIIDITERKQAEEQFRLTVEASPNAIILVGMDGHISLVNTQTEVLFGYSREELLNQPIELLLPTPFRANHKAYRDAFFKEPSTRPMGAGRDLFGLRKDGRQVPVEIGLNPITIMEGNFVLASIIDITERKQAEADIADLLQREKAARLEVTKLNEELERRVMDRTAQLQAANKELEAFSYSVSHDLRAPLRSIDGFSQALLEDYFDSLDSEAQHYLHRVRAGSQRMAQLIDELLLLSRLTRSEMHRETVDLSGLVRTVADEFRQREPERQVTFVIEPGVSAQADRQLIQAVLENLVGNAWKFTSKRSDGRIEFGVMPQPDGQRTYYLRDNGAGFNMAYADKLFGAFQRLHTPAEFPGTGIGLASVQRIINRHGGRIWAEGVVGEGATFYFILSPFQD